MFVCPVIMEECVDRNVPPSSSILKIKKEPKDEEDCHYNLEPDYHFARSLILKFKKDKSGVYYVVPFIKPDPFFEEDLDDLCHEDTLVKSRSQENQLNYDKDEKIVIKQETVDSDLKDQTDQSKNRQTENIESIEDGSPTARCPSCLYTNTKKLVKRHIQRVHISITKHSCPFCDKKNFKEPLSLDCHILGSHRDVQGALDRIRRTIFECTFCTYKTLKRNNFTRHLTSHGEGRLKKHLEIKGDANSLVGIQGKHELKMALSTTRYDCFHCPYTTKDKGAIIKHLRLHKESTRLPFCCKACNRAFNEKKSLDSHIVKRHIGNSDLLQLVTNTVHECDLCNYKDVNRSKLIRHQRARHVKKEKKKKKIRHKSR